MKVGSFVFVHDQNIILDYEKTNKFKTLPNLTYVFLGNKPTNMVQELKNVFISKNSYPNLEEYPLLTSFTGWYSIWKNKLHHNYDFIHMFEYDVNLSEEFNSKIENTQKNGVIAYLSINVHDINFLKTERWSKDLVNCLNQKYGKNILEIFDSFPKDLMCGITSNHSFNKDIFERYMEWVEPMIGVIKKSNLSGHQIERSIPCFYILEGISYIFVENVLKHLQLDSHGTQYETNEKFIKEYYNLIN